MAAAPAGAQRHDVDVDADRRGLDAVAVVQLQQSAREGEAVAQADDDAELDRVADAERRLDQAGGGDAEAAVPGRADPAADLPGVPPAEPQLPRHPARVMPAERAEPAELGVVERAGATQVVDEDRAVGRGEAGDVAGAHGPPGRGEAARPHRPGAVRVRDGERVRADRDPDRGFLSPGSHGEGERQDRENDEGRAHLAVRSSARCRPPIPLTCSSPGTLGDSDAWSNRVRERGPARGVAADARARRGRTGSSAASTTLPGVGQALARRLARLGLRTVGDLLLHRPRRYEEAAPERAIARPVRRGGGRDRRDGGAALRAGGRRGA